MILRRLFTLTALSVAVLLSFSGRAHASYDTSVSVNSISDPGGGALSQFFAATSFTDARLNGGNPISTPNGYSTFVDAGSSTIYFVNQVLGPIPPGPPLSGGSVVNEALFVSTASASDTSTWSVSLQIAVANPGGGATFGSTIGYFGSGTGSAAISETATFVMNIANGAGQVTPRQPSGLPPSTPILTGATTIIVGPNSFLLDSPSALGQQANASTNNGGIAANITSGAVPEPASMVMLGSGLAGVLVLGLRRRSKVV